MAFADTVRDFLANTITDHTTQILLVAAVAIGVALALSFLARIAFWVLGGAGTVGAVWILASGGISASSLTLAGIVFVGGWVGGFLVKNMIKVGAVIVTLFGYGLFWLTGWASGHDTAPVVLPWATWSLVVHAVVAATLVVAVLVIPTIVGKMAKGAVKTIIPGGGDKKDERKPERAPEMKR